MENIQNKLQKNVCSREIIIVQHSDTGTSVCIREYANDSKPISLVEINDANLLKSDSSTIELIRLADDIKSRFLLEKT